MKHLTRIALGMGAICCALGAQAQNTVNVVAILATSGPAGVYGAPNEKALRVIVDSLPGKMLAGRHINLTVYDTEGKPDKAAQLVRRAVDNDEAHVIFGPSTSGETMAAAPIADQLKVSVLSNGGAELITKPVQPWLFALPVTDRIMVEALLDSMKQRGMKKVALVYSMDGYGQSGAKVAQELIPTSGLELVAVESFAPQDTNTTPQLLRVRDKNPDGILVWSANPGPTIVARNAVEIGLKKPIFVSMANATISFVKQTGPAAEGIYAAANPIVAPQALEDSDARKAIIVKFNKQYSDKYGTAPDQAASNGLDAMLILEEALKAIKGPVSRENLRAAIEGVKMCGSAGCRQISASDHRGLKSDAVVVLQVKNGDFARPSK